jgi:hydroxyethylthiazole kinase-like sugar kinase family protein
MPVGNADDGRAVDDQIRRAADGDRAAILGREAAGPASFQTRFLDALYNLGEEDIAVRLKMESS